MQSMVLFTGSHSARGYCTCVWFVCVCVCVCVFVHGFIHGPAQCPGMLHLRVFCVCVCVCVCSCVCV
jgi:hypothetical protein